MLLKFEEPLFTEKKELGLLMALLLCKMLLVHYSKFLPICLAKAKLLLVEPQKRKEIFSLPCKNPSGRPGTILLEKRILFLMREEFLVRKGSCMWQVSRMAACLSMLLNASKMLFWEEMKKASPNGILFN